MVYTKMDKTIKVLFISLIFILIIINFTLFFWFHKNQKNVHKELELKINKLYELKSKELNHLLEYNKSLEYRLDKLENVNK